MMNSPAYSATRRSYLHEAARGQTRLLQRAPSDPGCFALSMLRTERKEHLDFVSRPYLLQPLYDPTPNQTAVACAQSGKTVTWFAKTVQKLVFPLRGRPRTAIWTFPTDSDVRAFSAARVKTMLTTSRHLRRHMGDLDQVGVKQFLNGSTIYFRGTKSEVVALSIPCDYLIHDELDRSQPDTLQLYQDRTRNSDDRRCFLFSTPTIPGYGVSAAWETTNQHEWIWSCGACGRRQVFAPMDKSTPWQQHLDPDEGVFRCCYCQAEVEREWVHNGYWEAQEPSNSDHAGYHVTGIMPPNADAATLAKEYRKAEFPELVVQGGIGLPEVSGENELTADMIAFGAWQSTLVSDGTLYAGLDQGKKLDFMAGDGQGKLVCVERFDDWNQVASAMETLKIMRLVADAQPDARPVQDLVARFPGRVVMADYSLTTLPAEECFERVHDEPRVRIHRTAGLDWTRDRIMLGKSGGDVFPTLGYETEQVLKAHLTASKRAMEKDQHGNPRAVWKETAADHLRHAHLYYCVACRLGEGVPAWERPDLWQQWEQYEQRRREDEGG